MQDEQPATPPGWYPDPGQPGQLRYWTGSAWSTEVQGARTPTGAAARPWWQQWWAIVLTLAVCFPLGVVGVWQRQGTSTGVKVAVTAIALAVNAAAWSLRTSS